MTNTPLDDMKAALEANGYQVTANDYPAGIWHTAYAPDGWTYEHHEKFVCIQKAYAHLQQQQKTKVLEAFVLSIASNDSEYLIDMKYDVLAAQDIVKQFNITADDDSADSENET